MDHVIHPDVELSSPSAAATVDGGDGLGELITGLVSRLSLEQKVALVTGDSFWTTPACPEIGLRALTMSDGPAGVRGRFWSEQHPSASLPSAACLAATFDPSLIERAGRLVGGEARRNGVDLLLGPTVNLVRSAFGGRNFEAFSEDALLTAEIAGALVDGVQAEGVAATAKHFIGNDCETDRMTADSVIDESTLRGVYALPFEELVVEHDVAAVMSSYNRINGVWGTESPLLTKLLRGEWGFDGLVVSDWGAVRSLEASAAGGTDVAMPGPVSPWSEGLVAAVRDGRVAEADVDRKVASLLRLAARVGALDGVAPRVDPSTLEPPRDPADPDVRELLTTLAVRGSVLLRNADGLLPLAEDVSSIAVIGPAARRLRVGGGGSATVVPPHIVTVVDGLREAFPAAALRVAEGLVRDELLPPLGDRSRAADGSAGYDVEFLDAAGTLLGTQVRSGGELVYGMGFPDGIDETRVSRIRVSLRLDEVGPRRLGFAGIGHFRVTIDGRIVLDRTLHNEQEDEIAGLSRPGQLVHEADLTGGERVVIDHDPEPDTIVAIRLGLDGPARSADELREEAVRAARESEVAIVVVGSTAADESEGFDRTTLGVGPEMDDLIEAVAAANPRTVVVLNVGAPVLLPWRERVAGILLAHFPGQEGGTAIGRVLSGAAEPGGRLPVSWPRAASSPVPSVTPVDGQLHYAERERFGYRDPGGDFAFEFADGLGYTTWERSAVRAGFADDGSLWARARVTNTGSRPGRQQLMLFLGSRFEPSLRFAGVALVEACLLYTSPSPRD